MSDNVGDELTTRIDADLAYLQARYARVPTVADGRALAGWDFPNINHGLTDVEYAKQHNHASHLSDVVGVFRSDCEGCQKHFAEAFGPVIERVIATYQHDKQIAHGLTATRLLSMAGTSIRRGSNGDLYAAIAYLLAALEVTGD